jgi:hypothetical protein
MAGRRGIRRAQRSNLLPLSRELLPAKPKLIPASMIGGVAPGKGETSGQMDNGARRDMRQLAPDFTGLRGAGFPMTRSLAADWANTGARVNAVALIYIVTEITRFPTAHAPRLP